MKKIILFLFFSVHMVSSVLSQTDSRVQFNLDKMQFDAFIPGTFNEYNCYVAPEDTISPLNYYIKSALWIGVKQGNNVTVISGDGNPTVKEFTEWKIVEKMHKTETVSSYNYIVDIYKTIYDDHIPMPGHTPIGITVTQKIFEFKQLPAIICEYTVKPQTSIDSLCIGIFYDFDIPEEDNTSNPYNDQVLIEPRKKVVLMSNNGRWIKSPIPAVAGLQDDSFHCEVRGTQNSAYSDVEKWEILSKINRYKKRTLLSKPDDYRFIIHSDIKTISKGDSSVYSVA